MNRLFLKIPMLAGICAIAALIPSARAATTFMWNVPAPGPNLWNVNANWLPPTGNPGSADTAIFGITGTNSAASPSTINNIVSVPTSITTLKYTNNVSGSTHVTQIPGGVTLSVSSSVIVGGGFSDTDTTSASIVDAGTLAVSGPTFIIGVQGSGSLNSGTILDLSRLSNFVYNSSSGLIGMGVSNRSTASLTLAAGSNFITAATISLDTGSSSSSGTAGNLKFGFGTNVINVGTMNIAANRTAGTATFAGVTGGLRLRGAGGTDNDRATVVLGNRNTGSSSGGTTTGTLNFNGHPVSAKISTLTLGQESSAANAGLIGVGNLFFDTGTVDALTINMGICTGNNNTNGGIGNLTVGSGGTLYANAISLCNNSIAPSAGTNTGGTGTLFVNGGTAFCTNNIVKTTTANSTGTVAVANGLLYVQGKIGNPGAPIDNLNVTNAALRMNVDASSAITTNAVVSTINPGGATVIDITQVTGVSGPVTIPLVAYTTLNGFALANFTVTVDPGGYNYSLVDNFPQQRIDLSISPSVLTAPLIWTGATNGDWDTSTSNWVSGGVVATYTNGSATVFDDSAYPAFNGTVNLTTTLSPGSMVMSNFGVSHGYIFSGPGSLAGTNSLIVRGSAGTELDNVGSNSFTGGVTIGAGALLYIGNSDANGNLPDSTTVVNNGRLIYTRTDNVTNNDSISGAGILTQQGSGTLTLIAVNSYDTTDIEAGTLQVGAGGASGTLGSGSVADNGALIFNRSDTNTVSNAINGLGSVTKNGNGVLNLSGVNGYGGGLTVNSGMVRLSSTAAGTGTLTVNGGAAVWGSVQPVHIVMAGGTFGVSATLGSLTNELTASPATTSTVFEADPQNLAATDATELIFSNAWHGSGTVIIATVTNDPSPDSGNGFRLRGVVTSDFSGTLTLSNKVKGELQTSVAGPFSPAGTGKLVIYGGVLSNNTVNGTFSELNFRDNSAGSTTIGNDVEVAGSGLAVVDPLGTAPSGSTVTMGNLKIGAGQELGVNLNGTASPPTNHPVIFPTVTLNGGNATFSPKTSGWNTAPQWGSDLQLGTISELMPGSGFTMRGLMSLVLMGSSANTYSGPTTNASGTLVLNKSSGNAIPGPLAIPGGIVSLSAGNQIADSSAITISGGTLAMGGNNDTVGSISLNGGSITGPGILTANSDYDMESGSVSAALSGPVQLLKTTAGTVSLTAPSTYTGTTFVQVGTLALTGSGSIANSLNIDIYAGATLDVSGLPGGLLTLASGQTLETLQNGSVNGSVTEPPTAFVSPGDMHAIGSLTITGAVVCLGDTIMDLNKTLMTNDTLTAGSIAYGGTLTMPVVGTLANGDSFHLFVANSYAGTFAAFGPATPYPGGIWYTNLLTVNGTIIATNPVPPTIACPSDITVACAGPNGTPVTYSPTATDMFGNSLPVTSTPPSGTPFPFGRTPVSCTTTDSFGNTASCAFTVTVTDNSSVSLNVAFDGSNVILSWPQGCGDYGLQSNSTLDGTAPWIPVSAPVISSSGTSTVTLPISSIGSSVAFFRLAKSPTLSFSQLNLNLDDGYHPYSDGGAVDLTYTGSSNFLYFNLSVNGAWQVQNIALQSLAGAGAPETVTMGFLLGSNGVPVTSVHYDYSLTPFVLASMPLGSSPTGSITAPVSQRLVQLFSGIQGASNIYVAAGTLTGGSTTNKLGPTRTNLPNHDVGTNECVPGAVWNGLEGIGVTNLSMGTTKAATLWRSNGCTIYYYTNTGYADLTSGWWTNKAVVMSNNVPPISTTPTTSIAAAMAASCNPKCCVEINSPVHCAVVRGCILDLGGGKYGINIAHDLKQGVPGGTTEDPLIWDSNSNMVAGGINGDGFKGFPISAFIIECRTD